MAPAPAPHCELLVLHAELLTMRGGGGSAADSAGLGYVACGGLAVDAAGVIVGVGDARTLRERFTAAVTLDGARAPLRTRVALC